MAVVAVPATGSDHLASEREGEPKAAKTIAITPDGHVMLVGDKRRLDAQVCDADGSSCKDAGNKAKWSVKPKNGLKLSPKKGVSSVAEGRKPGTYTVTVKQGGASGSTTVTINEPPVRDAAEAPEAASARLVLDPEFATLRLGEIGIFNAWACPERTLSEACTPQEIISLNPDEGAALDVWGPVGNTFAVRPTGFPEGLDGDLAFVGSQVQTEIGGTLPELTVENAEFDRNQPTDLDSDGDVDADDLAALAALVAAAEPVDDPGFDLNRDGTVDQADADLWQLLSVPPVDDAAEASETEDEDEDAEGEEP